MSKQTAASRLVAIMQVLAEELDRDAPIAQAYAFSVIAAAGDAGISQAKVQDTLKLSTAGISRTVQALSKTHYSKERAGFNLIERIIDPIDNRQRSLKLTSDGEKVLTRIAEKLR